MDQRAKEFVQSQKLAVIGVSKRKFGGTIYRTLKKRGYQVYPVHPTRKSFDGDACFSSLTELPNGVDAAIVAVSPLHADDVVEDAKSAGIAKLWFQQGADFQDTVLKAEAYGIQTVSGKCILMYAAPVTGIHAVHRFLARVFGKY